MTAENLEVENLEVEAAGLLIGLQGMHGENLLLFREPEHLALLCEANAELAGWMRTRSQFGVVAEWSWRHTKAHLDSRAASRAFDSVIKPPEARRSQPLGRAEGASGEVAARLHRMRTHQSRYAPAGRNLHLALVPRSESTPDRSK